MPLGSRLALFKLKPVMPDHVLMILRRVVPRFADLTVLEVNDMMKASAVAASWSERGLDHHDSGRRVVISKTQRHMMGDLNTCATCKPGRTCRGPNRASCAHSHYAATQGNATWTRRCRESMLILRTQERYGVGRTWKWKLRNLGYFSTSLLQRRMHRHLEWRTVDASPSRRMQPTSVIALAAALASGAAASRTHSLKAALSPNSPESECALVDLPSPVCGRWVLGTRVNLTALQAVYGLQLYSASQWDQALRLRTEKEGMNWYQPGWTYLKDTFGCTKGFDQLDHLATYYCLRDVDVSLGCNTGGLPKSQPPCEKTCDELEGSLQKVFSDPSLCPIDVNRYPVEFSVSQDQFTMWMEVRKAAMNIGGSCKAAIGQIWPGIDQTNCIKDVGVSSMTKEAFSFKQWPPSMHISKQSKVKGQMGSSAKYGNDPQKMPSIARIANIAPFPPQQKLDQQQIPVPPIMQAQIADSASRLSTAGIAGIVLGSVVGLSVLAFLIFYAVRQSRSASDPIYQSIPKRAPLSTLASYNNRGGAPSDYYPITEDMDLKKRGSSASLPRPGSRQSVTLEYTAAQPDELSVRVGDVLVLREYREKGWGLGVLERTRSTGLFPLVCVGIVEPDD